MTMLEMAENAAMEHLSRGPMTCANLGWLLWGARKGRQTWNCSCPFARPAGRVLRGLAKRGLVGTVPHKSGDVLTLWALTRKGREHRKASR